MFSIIDYQQTPKLNPMADPSLFIKEQRGLLESFLKYSETESGGIGLAANQVSFEGERIMERFAAIRTSDGWLMAINPKVEEFIGESFETTEGCLTWPGKTIVVDRFPEVLVSYMNMDGKECTRKTEDVIESQVWQHEINHLNGVEEVFAPNDYLTVRKPRKLGRNAACICGSGRKYKKCCLGKGHSLK
mgnify:CR=1 FL=1